MSIFKGVFQELTITFIPTENPHNSEPFVSLATVTHRCLFFNVVYFPTILSNDLKVQIKHFPITLV